MPERAGATAEQRQVSLRINEPEGEKKKKTRRTRRGGQSHHKNKRTCGEKGEKKRRAGMAANEEDAFRNGLGRVCGETVARR